MKLHIFVITSVLVLAACGNNTNQATAKTSVTTDGKHSVEYITQRLNAIYNDVYSNAFMLIENDHKYMSSEYNRLQDKAMEIAQRNGDLVVDADHWIQGQEWTEPKMTVQSVNDITENTANAVVKITKFVLGEKGDGKARVEELSGLCLSKDQDFLWGVHDKGTLYRINFDGTFQKQYYHEADFEGLTIDPATGDLYVGLESSSKSAYKIAAPNYNTHESIGFVVEGAESMSNSGVEGIAWHKGNLYFGTQTGARLFEYTLDGTQLWKRSLRDVTPTISEVGDLCYDPVSDYLWVLDSNSNKDRPEYLPYTLYLFNGDGTKLLNTYYIGDFANWNPEAVCVDHKNGCIWIGDDCDSGNPSWLHKVEFSNL